MIYVQLNIIHNFIHKPWVAEITLLNWIVFWESQTYFKVKPDNLNKLIVDIFRNMQICSLCTENLKNTYN